MKTVNIPRTVSDPKYRYKMPLLQQKIEGKGINIRTNLTNLKDVGKSLRVPGDYILKFMGIEFGSNTNTKEGLFSINGEMNADDVLRMLDKFIDRFVLCPKCKLPEMVLQVTPKKSLTGKCNSCGNTAELDGHKLSTYIIKNPPENRSEMKNIKTAATNFDVSGDTRTDLQSARRELRQLIEGSHFSPLAEEDRALFARVTAYLNLVLPMTDAYQFDDGHVELVYKAIKRLRLDKIFYDRIGFVLFNYLFDEGLLKQIDSRAILFEGVLTRHKMGEFVGHEVLLNIQHFCYRPGAAPEWGKRVPTILKKFHDQDLLTDVD